MYLRFFASLLSPLEICSKTRSKQAFSAEFCGVTLSPYGHAHEGTNDKFCGRGRGRSRCRI